jgi:tetratricopeptide (TPR) repeat protein
LQTAASILYGHEQSKTYPEVKEALTEAAAAGGGGGGKSTDDKADSGLMEQPSQEQQQQQPEQEQSNGHPHHKHHQQQQQEKVALPQGIATALQSGAAATKPQLETAKKVAEAVRDLLKGSIKRDIILVLPIVPSAAVRLDAAPAVQESFLERVHQFAAVSALAGLPSVIVPVGRVKDGAELCIAFCAQQRNDQRLLAVAAKLLPFIQAEREKLLVAQEEAQIAAAEATRAAAAPGAGGRGKGSSSRSRGGRVPTNTSGTAATATPPTTSSSRAGQHGKSRTGSRPQQEHRHQHQAAVAAAPPDPKKVERAEKFKAKGNEFFKVGRYVDAVKQYSEAVRMHPDNPVYYSNRAMAYLKTFM